MSDNKGLKQLFLFIAPPNGGKGTQTISLAKRFSIPKIDMGSVLRQMAQEDSEIGRQIRDRQANGQLVQTHTVLQALKAELIKKNAENPNGVGFILDGFPRNQEQAEGLSEMSNELGAYIAKAFYLKVPDEVILERAINRRICPVGGEIYNLSTKPPQIDNVCDVDGAQLIQRTDDTLDKVQNRLQSFQDETRPMIAHFRQAGLLAKIDGNRPEKVVTEEIAAEMQAHLDKFSSVSKPVV